jgi:hypothetical protein
LNSTNSSTLAAWKSATGQEANSISSDPQFTSSTNLHIKYISSVSGGCSRLLLLQELPQILDGDTRNASTPDIGGDEFTPPTILDIGAKCIGFSRLQAQAVIQRVKM